MIQLNPEIIVDDEALEVEEAAEEIQEQQVLSRLQLPLVEYKLVRIHMTRFIIDYHLTIIFLCGMTTWSVFY